MGGVNEETVMHMPQRTQPYLDRSDAARELTRAIQCAFPPPHDPPSGPPPREPGVHPATPELVIGLCRGGVPIALQIGRQLGIPTDILVVRKIAGQQNPEMALGAVAECSPAAVEVLNPCMSRQQEHADAALQTVRRAAYDELQRRVVRYRGSAPPVAVAGKRVLIVDDGAATGATMRAAIKSVRMRGARRVDIALPVAPEETLAELASDADGAICPWCPPFFLSVGSYYRHFPQVEDEEVLLALEQAGEPPPLQNRLMSQKNTRTATDSKLGIETPG